MPGLAVQQYATARRRQRFNPTSKACAVICRQSVACGPAIRRLDSIEQSCSPPTNLMFAIAAEALCKVPHLLAAIQRIGFQLFASNHCLPAGIPASGVPCCLGSTARQRLALCAPPLCPGPGGSGRAGQRLRKRGRRAAAAHLPHAAVGLGQLGHTDAAAQCVLLRCWGVQLTEAGAYSAQPVVPIAAHRCLPPVCHQQLISRHILLLGAQFPPSRLPEAALA